MKELICSSDTSNLDEKEDADWFFDDFREAFYEAINSNYGESKKYYVTGSNMGWRNKSGHRVVTENENLLDIFSVNGDYHLNICKIDDVDKPIQVERYSHDEPTGAFFAIYDFDNAVKLKLVEDEE